MTFDAVIATYNRPEKVDHLVLALKACDPPFQKIIVVDSSDLENHLLLQTSGIIYLRSAHKNQPYQRYLGMMASQADCLVYFDDDMEIIDPAFLHRFEQEFQNPDLAGLQTGMRNLHEFETIEIHDSILAGIWRKDHPVVDVIRWVTMYPRLPYGTWWYCGLRGPKPATESCTLQWFSGWAFAAKRSLLFNNFNFQLLDLFENRFGMGEDLLIGHLLSKQGPVKYIPDLLFYHNDQRSSTYTSDHYTFSRRTLFSRLYLSLEYARLNGKSLLKARLIFYYFAMIRILGYLLNTILTFRLSTFRMLKGSISGLAMATRFQYDIRNHRAAYWKSELERNAAQAL